MTSVAGATLQVTYKGAHATRPADEIDVDSFIGVKSHRAKGKRITTYDVATLSFVEPEIVEDAVEEDMTDEDVDVTLDQIEGADVEQVEKSEKISQSSSVVSMGASDEGIVVDPEQLNLF